MVLTETEVEGGHGFVDGGCRVMNDEVEGEYADG